MMSVLDQFDLDGRVAIVTGGSRGIGRAISLSLSEAGATVVPASRTPEVRQMDCSCTADLETDIGSINFSVGYA